MVWALLLLACADSAVSYRLAVSPRESLQVTVAGEGLPIVLVPGLFGSAFGYRKLIPRLHDAGYRTVVIEPLGYGSSARPERADYSLTAQADRVARALTALSIDRVWVVAHSLGGSIALRLAYRHPDRVLGVLLLDAGPAEAASSPGLRRAMRYAPWIRFFGGARLIRAKLRGQLVASSGDTSWITDETLDGYTDPLARDLIATLKALVAMTRAREPEALQAHLEGVTCPVRLVVGGARHEGGPPPAEVALLTGRLPVFAADTLAHVGHFPHEERPDAIVEALDRLRGAAIGQSR